MQTYDVIIIGGGFLGLSSAYQLSRMGIKPLVLEAGDIGGGTSASCSGRAQVCEGHLDPLNLMLIRAGIKKLAVLEEELGYSFNWRKAGIFLLIKSDALWELWKERSSTLSHSGIPTEVVDAKVLHNAEPNLNTAGLLGAAYSVEGMLDPLKLTRAYARAAQRQGAIIKGNSPVAGMEVHNGHVVTVKTKQDTYSCAKVAVMAGAWEPVITRMAGVEVPIRHTHAEALVTEAIPKMIYNNIELADFYETIHGKLKAVAIGVHPETNGTLDVSEAVTRTDQLHRRVSAWGLTKISADLIKFFPFLAKVRILRSWGRPTSFTPDEEPLIGWLPQLDNMFVASSLMETITTIPVISEWMAMMILGQDLPASLDAYSPARFSHGWTWN
jgi:glycine/D-amino acid oxidase-like deaminating enzyme